MEPMFTKHYRTLRPEVYEYLMEHPIEGIPKIYQVEQTEDEWVVREEYIEGRNLYEVLCEGLFDRYKACEVGIRICDILDRLHSIGIVHGDIKPENILVKEDGTIYLVDFDASHYEKKALGHDTVLLGTPGYAAPEQFGFERSDRRSDIYAIGQLLNIMLTGQFTQYVLAKGPLSHVIRQCVQIKSEDRYQKLSSLRYDLLRYGNRKHSYNPYRPPGFRSLRPWKMTIAGLAYIWIFAIPVIIICTGSLVYTEESPVYVAWGWTAMYWLLSIGIIIIYWDYLNINEWFAFARKNYGFKVLAKIIETLVFFCLWVTIVIVTLGFILPAIFSTG